ncbi:MAG: diguanylate cyclase [Planctomycetes bacterium]|nr:diguanylate cyclase [Planctomycetota bacterium]
MTKSTKKEFKKLSIKSSLLTFSLCISLIPIAVITTIYTFHSRSKLVHQRLNELTAIAESKRIHVLSFVKSKIGRTIDFSSDKFIRNSLDKINHIKPYPGETVIALNSYLSEFKKPLEPQITAIAITDKDGIIVASSLKELAGADISGQAIFRRAMSKGFGEAYVEQPSYMPLLKANIFIISAPVAYRTGANRGVLINYYDSEVLAEITADRIGLGNTGEVYLVNDNKHMLTESRFIDNAPLKQVVDTAPIRRIAEEGKEMVGIYPDYRGIPVVGASAHIPEYGWTLLAEIDKAEVFEPLKTLTVVAIVTGGICAAVVIGAGIIYTVSLVKPIYELKYASEKFGKGDLNYRVTTRRNNEFDALACSFNIMADELAEEIKKNEQTTKRLQEFYHTIKECASMVIITDNKGNIEYVNPMFSKVTGYTTEEVIGQNPRILKSGKTTPEKYKQLWETVTSGGTWHGEFVNRKKDGKFYWESVSISSVKNDDGSIYRFIKISDDITRHMQTKRRLDTQNAVITVLAQSTTLKDASAKILRTLCECLEWEVGGMWVYDLQTNALQCVDMWHIPYREFPEFEAVSRQIAMSPGIGLPGRVWITANPVWIDDVVPDSNFPRNVVAKKEGLHGAFGFPIQAGNKVLGVIEFFSNEVKQPDDDLLNTMSSIGKQIGLFMQRKQAEEQLRNLSAAVEQNPTTIIITNMGGSIEYVNPAFVKQTGYTAEEAIGQNPRILKSGKTPQEVYERLWKTITSGKVWHGEILNRKKGGSLYWGYASIFPIRNHVGAITNFIGIVEDVTERKRIDEELKLLTESLEQHVAERTKELTKTSEELQVEIAEHKRLEEERNKKINDLTNLIDFSGLMENEVQEEDIVKHANMILKNLFLPDMLSILMLNKEKNMLDVSIVNPPIPLDKFARKELFLNPSLCRVIRTGQPLVVKDVTTDVSCECLVHKIETGGYLCLPLIAGGNTIGVVQMVKKEKDYWNNAETYRLISTYAGLTANAIHRVRLTGITKLAAITDALTGVYNRRYFDDMLEKLVALTKRYNEPLSILIADIDHFKSINDTYGHIAGDLILQQITKGILCSLRKSDVITRYGGEEFAIILPATNITSAVEKADRIRQQVESVNFDTIGTEKPIKTTISIGVANFPEHGAECDAIVMAADSALYKAKRSGRNRVETP